MSNLSHKIIVLTIFIFLPLVASSDWQNLTMSDYYESLLHDLWVRVIIFIVFLFCVIKKLKKKFTYYADVHILFFDALLAIYLFSSYKYPYRTAQWETESQMDFFIRLFFKRDVFLGFVLLLHTVNISLGLLKTNINTRSK